MILLTETIAGKSLGRILLNQIINKWGITFGGNIIDICSGEKRPSYFRYLKLEKKSEIVSVDLNNNLKPTIIADLSRKLPMASSTVNNAILLNAIYLFKYPVDLLREINRILVRDGLLLINFPLVWPVTNEPVDYWRFTDNSIKDLLTKTNFTIVKIESYGGRVTSALSLIEIFMPRILRLVLYPLVLVGDKLIMIYAKSITKCPLGYIVLASKK